jgi:murein DD-endopeptidase MepM/ murein hydrolase activator NlpD
LKTIIPSRPRVEVITYTVQTGDTLFSIAANFSLKPETLLWGNYEVLNDNPHLLKPNQVLNILPVNGVYYEWQEGDTLEGVATFFKTDPQSIINYSGNFIDLTEVGENGAGIEPGAWIIIPGGKRAIKDWGPPAITRQNPASARYYGGGACGDVYEGAVGTGTFIWPTTEHFISGNNYDANVHPAIDIGGQEGNPIYATDSGVVVYAGWSDYGYGYLIVIDHGNGWQSAYAHLSAVGVSCGQSVYQGSTIGALGTTGNSTGPHLHFELVINGAKINPLDYMQ